MESSEMKLIRFVRIFVFVCFNLLQSNKFSLVLSSPDSSYLVKDADKFDENGVDSGMGFVSRRHIGSLHTLDDLHRRTYQLLSKDAGISGPDQSNLQSSDMNSKRIKNSIFHIIQSKLKASILFWDASDTAPILSALSSNSLEQISSVSLANITTQAVSGVKNKELQKSSWPKASGNNDNTGRTFAFGDKTGNLFWKYKVASAVTQFFASPVIDISGNVIIGGDDGMVYSVNNDGHLMWNFTSDGSIKNSVAIAQDGTIYFGTFVGTFYALQSNGKFLWKFRKPGSYIASSAAIGVDGTIYYGAGDLSTKVGPDLTGSLYALNPLDGSVKWRSIVPSPILYSSPALGPDGMLYIGSFDYHLHAINSTGGHVWKFKTAGYVESAPVISVRKMKTVIYVTSYVNLYALYPNGTVKWTFNTTNLISSSPAVGTDGTVFVTSRDNFLYAVNPNSGELKWRFQTGWSIFTTPAIGADNTVYFGSTDSYLYAVNGNTSALVWKRQTEGALQIRSSVAIGGDGSVVVGLLSGYIVSYRWYSPTGQPTTAPSSSPPSFAPSLMPSYQPSSLPSDAPSAHPTSTPSCVAGHIYYTDAADPAIRTEILVSRCGNCTRGTYSSTPGALYCTLCPQGTIAPHIGSAHCRVCPYPMTNLIANPVSFGLHMNADRSATAVSSSNEVGSVGEKRTECHAVNLRITRNVLISVFLSIAATSIGASIYILRSQRHRKLRGKEGTRNIILGFLVFLSNVESCSYLYLLCTVTIITKIFLFMWLSLITHSSSFLIILYLACRNDRDEKSSSKSNTAVPKSLGKGRPSKGHTDVETRKFKHRGYQLFDQSTTEPGDCNMGTPNTGDGGTDKRGVFVKHTVTIENNLFKNKVLQLSIPFKHSINNKSDNTIVKTSRSSNSKIATIASCSIDSCFVTRLNPAKKASRSFAPLSFTFESFCSRVFWLTRDGEYATYGGVRFPFSPKKHNTFLLFSFEVLIWCVAIVLQIATIMLCPLLPVVIILFYPIWLLIGALLFSLRLLPFRCVWGGWYHVWRSMIPRCGTRLEVDEKDQGQHSEQDAKVSQISFDSTKKRRTSLNSEKDDSLDTTLHLYLVTASSISGFCLQTLPMLLLLVFNCYLSGEWATGAIISLYCSSVMLISGPILFGVYYYLAYYSPRTSFVYPGKVAYIADSDAAEPDPEGAEMVSVTGLESEPGSEPTDTGMWPKPSPRSASRHHSQTFRSQEDGKSQIFCNVTDCDEDGHTARMKAQASIRRYQELCPSASVRGRESPSASVRGRESDVAVVKNSGALQQIGVKYGDSVVLDVSRDFNEREDMVDGKAKFDHSDCLPGTTISPSLSFFPKIPLPSIRVVPCERSQQSEPRLGVKDDVTLNM